MRCVCVCICFIRAHLFGTRFSTFLFEDIVQDSGNANKNNHYIMMLLRLQSGILIIVIVVHVINIIVIIISMFVSLNFSLLKIYIFIKVKQVNHFVTLKEPYLSLIYAGYLQKFRFSSILSNF